MRYNKEIKDPALIQYIILFAASEFDKPISSSFLTKLILKSCNINYMDLQIAIANLIDTDHMRQFYSPNNTHMYELLPMGITALEYARREVPVYIREQISEQLEPLYNDTVMQNSVRAKLVPAGRGEFSAELSIYDRKTPLMQLSFYTGSKDQANSILKNFSEHPDEIYQKILKAIIPEEE
jgi:predicted transcriptional regulator